MIGSNKPGATMNAEVTVTGPSEAVAPGSTFSCLATIKNTGPEVWQCVVSNSSSPVRLGAMPQDSAPWGVWRIELPRDIQPGESFQLPMSGLIAPQNPGVYVCQWKMVWEQVQWFGQVGSCNVTVAGANSPPPVSPPPVSPPPVSPPPVSPPPVSPPPVAPIEFPPNRAADDLLYMRVFNTGPYMGGGWKSKILKNTSGQRVKVHKTYTWTGVDMQGKGDVACRVYRCEGIGANPNSADAFSFMLNPSALLGALDWDHYAEPNYPCGQLWDFSARPLVIEPGECVAMIYSSTVSGLNAHHVFEMWFTMESNPG